MPSKNTKIESASQDNSHAEYNDDDIAPLRPVSTDPSTFYLIRRLVNMTAITANQDRRITTDVSKDARYQAMYGSQQWDALAAERIMQISANSGYLDLSKSKRILDFGAGEGGPTLSLVVLAEANGGTVEAVESYEEIAHRIVESAVLPEDRVHAGDGIAFLDAPERRGSYDLITAFMLGPDDDGVLSRGLLGGAKSALADGGRLLMTSDMTTVNTFRSECQNMGLGYGELTGNVPTEDWPLPSVVVVSFSEK